jgi:hypothetical protein
VCRTGRGSLGEVLPPSLKTTLASAAVADATVTWNGEGRGHAFVVHGHLHHRPLDTVAG